ncbi:MAG: glycosyltransferase [Actinobacteria bacterium]|nr:glycosyltransferase [Actinomycetota bacterium]
MSVTDLSPRVLMLVINPMTADTRVDKQATALGAAGYDVTVLATAGEGLPSSEDRGDYAVTRLSYRRVIKDRVVDRRVREKSRHRDARYLVRAAIINRPVTDRGLLSLVVGWLHLLAIVGREIVSRLRWAVAGAVLKLVRSRILVAEYDAGMLSRVPAIMRRCDVVHAHDLGPLRGAIRLARHWSEQHPDLPRPRVIYDAHEFYVEQTTKWKRLESGLWRLHAQRWIRKADAVITVSDGIADAMQRRYRLRTRPIVIYNAPHDDPSEVAPSDLRRDVGIGSDEALAVYVGAVKEGRGIDRLLPALGQGRWHLALVGPGTDPQLHTVIAEARRVGLDDRLHVIPPVPAAALPSYISTADVGIHPMEPTCLNHDLALPNKLFDYVFGGLPIAVTDLREMGRFVRQYGLGLTFDVGNPGSVGATVEELVSHGEMYRASPELRGVLAERYGWRAQADKLLRVYDDLTAEVTGPALPARPVGVQGGDHDG